MKIIADEAKMAMYEGAKTACKTANKHRTTVLAAAAAIALVAVTATFIAHGVHGVSEAASRGLSSTMTLTSVGSVAALALARIHDKKRSDKQNSMIP